MGKTYLRNKYPNFIFDTDTILKETLENSNFPEINSLIKWKTFCRKNEWRTEKDKLEIWSVTRKKIIRGILDVYNSNQFKIIFTNLIFLPISYEGFFGIELGKYLYHLKMIGKDITEYIIEELENNVLEGYEPLFRLKPVSFLEESEIIQQLIKN